MTSRLALAGTVSLGMVMFAAVHLAAAQDGPGTAKTRPELNAPLPSAPPDEIAWRRANYKWMGQTFDGFKKAIADGVDVAPLAPQAADIAVWARRIPTVFPTGTETGGETKALPAIWSNHAVFAERAAALATNADKLATIAATGDKAAFAAQYQTTGAACGACHREFRAR